MNANPPSTRGASNIANTPMSAVFAENAYLRSEISLRNCALDAAASMFAMVDMLHPHMPLVYVNRSMAREHGYAREELIGRNLDSTTWQLSRARRAQIRNSMLKGEEIRTELQLCRKSGEVFWAGVFLGPVRDDDGRVTHYVCVGADITARIEAERKKRELQDQLYNEMRERERIAIELRLAQKLESVGRLAAGMAHEINTPIQYVGDSLYFLRSSVGDIQDLLDAYRAAFKRVAAGEPIAHIDADLARAEQRAEMDFLASEMPKAFERTLDGVSRVSGIVRAMKEFAHSDNNNHSAADINRALQNTLIIARSEYKFFAEVVTKLSELPQVTCNIGELNQVFLNLIVNAAHAIQASNQDASTGRITIETSADQDSVSITIGDNGCGIPGENIERIFDPFFTTKEVGKGTGQGLPIARSIVVDKHGGAINVFTEVGVGTRFVVTLPIERKTDS